MTKRALICGCNGFIGQYAVRAFQDEDWEVFGAGRGSPLHQPGPAGCIEGDFRDAAYVERLLNETRPTHLVFAAGPASVEDSFANPVKDFANQVLPLIQVLDGARRMANPPGILLVSSAAVYGNPTIVPVSENASCAPISPYGFHKLHQETLLDEFSVLFGLPTCKARVFSTYGAGLRHLAIWDITQRALHSEFTLNGSPGESRDYLHVSDVARALERTCSAATFHGETINVASGQETSIEQVARLIYNAVGVSDKPTYKGASGQGKPFRWQANVDRLRELGFSPRVALEEGVKDTVAWVRANA